ncbi:thioredoxin family protein [Bacteroidota bacterium]
MKKKIILLFAAFLLGSVSGFAQETQVKWISIEEAEKLNKENPKKIMVDVYTDWCGWCKKMDKETFSHPVIAKFINENYYAVKLDAEGKEEINFNGTAYKYIAQGNRGYHELAAGLLNGKMSYPSIAYLNEEMQLLGAVPGYMTPISIEPLLNYISENKFTSQSLEDYQKSFVSKLTK